MLLIKGSQSSRIDFIVENDDETFKSLEFKTHLNH